jgi:hypothetical protein
MRSRVRIIQIIVIPQQEDPATTNGDLVALANARRGHFGAVYDDKLGIRRRLDPKSALLPPDPAMHRPDSLAIQEHVARSACPEQNGMVTPELDELDPALTVVYFQGRHAYLSVSWATTSKS